MRELALEMTAFATLLLVMISLGWWARGLQEARRADTELQEVINGYREQAVRLRTIADRADTALVEQRIWHAAQRKRLEAWLALPDLDCGIDAAGVELWNAANAGADAGATAAGTAGPVPPPATDSGRPRADAGDQPRGSDAGAGRLRPPPGGTGRVDAGGK